jgi:hypothetical protein
MYIARETGGRGGGAGRERKRETEALYPILVIAQCIPHSSSYVGGRLGGGEGEEEEETEELEEEVLTTRWP